jgi:hypothetical protein
LKGFTSTVVAPICKPLIYSMASCAASCVS